jgi:hypothetical protein
VAENRSVFRIRLKSIEVSRKWRRHSLGLLVRAADRSKADKAEMAVGAAVDRAGPDSVAGESRGSNDYSATISFPIGQRLHWSGQVEELLYLSTNEA